MERLDGGYIRGYTAGLQKAREIFEYIGMDLKYHKVPLNGKTIVRILDVAIQGRENLRENPEAFVRYNSQSKDFEVFSLIKRTEVNNYEVYYSNYA